MKRFSQLLSISILLIALLLQPGCVRNASRAKGKVKLAVVVVVDQMRADYLTRFAGLFQGGFARLLDEGMVYTNAQHDHALTVTAAGHATIATGAFPSHHGVISNDWYDRKEQKNVYCAEDKDSKILGYPKQAGRSPKRLLRSTLGDWLKKASPASKVFAVSRKDRPAIMMGGKHPDGIFWYNGKRGDFVTSEYYMKSYPAWVDSFNALKLPDQYFANGWKKFLPEEDYFLSREDKFDREGDGIHTTFPHQFPSEAGKPDSKYYKALSASPFSDELVLQFAKTIVHEENLGSDAIPDLLFIGCSATDAIGHAYGPLSQESEDQMLRLDGYLADFFNFLDKKIGKENYTIVLTGDHGVLPLPEELARRGFDAKRVSAQDLMGLAGKIIRNVSKKYGIQDNLIAGFSNGILLNRQAMKNASVNQEELKATIATQLKKLPFIEDVFTDAELMSKSDQDNRPFFNAFKHSFYPGRSPDLMFRFKPYYLISRYAQGTSHGSPYAYDTHVPLIFSGHGFAPGKSTERVRTVDIATTLATLLNIQPPADVDGISLLQ